MRDLMIVGGGPAGLAVAVNAARAGMKVVVLEKRPGIIDKACGEGLMPGALRALLALGIDPPGRDIRGIVYRQGSTVAHAAFRDGPGRGIRRSVLHEAMREAALAHAVEFVQRSAAGVKQFGDHVEIGGMRARYLVAADGLHSGIRRELGLDGAPVARRRWGLRRHYTISAPADYVQVFWAAASEAYVTPVDDRTVGVAILSSEPGSFDNQLMAFHELRAQLLDATPIADDRGAGPLRQSARRRVSGRVLLVGDAAGYVDALTGEGLALALTGAAQLTACLLAGEPEDYDRAWLRLSRRSRLITSALLWTRSQPALAPRIVPAAAANPRLFAAAIHQLAR